jgi:hypothetical protein
VHPEPAGVDENARRRMKATLCFAEETLGQEPDAGKRRESDPRTHRSARSASIRETRVALLAESQNVDPGDRAKRRTPQRGFRMEFDMRTPESSRILAKSRWSSSKYTLL